MRVVCVGVLGMYWWCNIARSADAQHAIDGGMDGISYQELEIITGRCVPTAIAVRYAMLFTQEQYRVLLPPFIR